MMYPPCYFILFSILLGVPNKLTKIVIAVVGARPHYLYHISAEAQEY